MSMTDPIADMLTRIRNANMTAKKSTDVRCSKLNEAIAAVLKREGYIEDFRMVENPPQNMIKVYLKYGRNSEKVIHEIKRESKPGRRRYVPADEIPRIKEGLGIAILSTSKGVMSDKECRKAHCGGEILCSVW